MRLFKIVLPALAALATFTFCSKPTPEPEPEPQPVKVTDVSLSKTSLSLMVGEEYTLTATVLPKDADDTNVVWSVDHPAVVSVNDGKVKALSEGEALITVKTEDGGFTATCKVSVKEEDKTISVTGISLDRTSLDMVAEDSFTLKATVTPSDATNPKVLWSSSDETVVSVNEGVLLALKSGSSTVTATTEDGGFKATCEVTVVDKTIPVTGVSLDKTSISLIVGEMASLKATVEPEDATDPSVTWSSDNEGVVVVEGGEITAVGAGTATITVKTEDGGFTATCDVTVNASCKVISYTTTDNLPVFLNLPESIGTLVSNTYYGETGLLVFEEDVTTIGERAFQSSSNLRGITIPETLKSIGNGAFMGCSSLESIDIPSGVTSIGESAFSGCTSLKSFSGALASDDGRCLIDGGKLIAFAPAGLTEFSVPSEVTSIGKAVFSGCYSLSSLTLPDGLTEIGPAAFRGCSSLTSIEIPAGVERIPTSAFEGCEILSEVNIPSSVKVIEQYAFMSCRSLQRIILPEGVETLGDDCFRMSTSLTIADLPSTVNRVGNNCFYDCLSLYSVTVRASVPPQLGSSAFRNIPVYCNFNVPADSMEAYKASSWNNYNGRLFPIEE